jgi:hypothetical protein
VNPDGVSVRVFTRGGKVYPGILTPSPDSRTPLVVIDGALYRPNEIIEGDVIRGVSANGDHSDSDSGLVRLFNRLARRTEDVPISDGSE